MSMQFMDAACNWADQKSVPVSALRSQMGDWYIRMEFKDGNGPFFAQIEAIEPTKRSKEKPAETPEDFEKRVGKKMDEACVHARRKRLVQFNHCDPRANSPQGVHQHPQVPSHDLAAS